ncbi:amidase family protein [Vagococcus luciliae]|uniref:Glutamyl-tRNA(Gln) amidotransferase subunit A, chloroplastic/mitochondrial n=1 Tax=Vagococcus luciliae TaxID=2920380 RepID=A0ABY5NX12_9ENTE|nr:amidase family protein [Vagococcus luciliae]UUV98038.1 Glutamyl-tRNA(Gln) amidotransferase subunit A, chloroplastic/mitochondrial [Vagococcus luciliae]
MSIKNRIKLLLATALLSVGIHTHAVDVPVTTTSSSTIVTNTPQHTNLTTDEYISMSATDLAKLVREKKVTIEELIDLAFQVNAIENPRTNALITTRKELALKEASEMIDNGQPFFGVPIVMKGLGHSIVGGSNSNGLDFNKHITTKFNGRIAKSLQDLGFVIIGQSNYPQLGLKNVTDSTLYGPTGSPWNPNFQAGGSSGGSGAAVASGVVPVASGSDAGGSIRIPASWNGLVGLKPSRGIILGNAKTGQVVNFPLAKNMEDTTALFENLLTSDINPTPANLTGIKVGYTTTSPVGTPVSDDAKQAVMNAVNFLNSKGFVTEEITVPVDGVKLMHGYYEIATASGSLANFLAKQTLKRSLHIDDVDPVTWALYQASEFVHKEDLETVNAYNDEVKETMEALYKDYPLILTPTTASTAPGLAESLLTPEYAEQIKHIDELKTKDERMKVVYDQWLNSLAYTPFTQLANLTGQPAISLPTYVSKDNLPLGIQFNAATNQDRLLLEIGKLFEENNQFKQLHTKKEVVVPETSDTMMSSTESTTETDSSSSLSSEMETSQTNDTMSQSENESTQETTSVTDTIPSESSTDSTTQTISDESKNSTTSTSETTDATISSTQQESSSTSSSSTLITEDDNILVTPTPETTDSKEISSSKQSSQSASSETSETSSQTDTKSQKTVSKNKKVNNDNQELNSLSRLPKTGEVIQKYLPFIGILIIGLVTIFWYIKKKK